MPATFPWDVCLYLLSCLERYCGMHTLKGLDLGLHMSGKRWFIGGYLHFWICESAAKCEYLLTAIIHFVTADGPEAGSTTWCWCTRQWIRTRASSRCQFVSPLCAWSMLACTQMHPDAPHARCGTSLFHLHARCWQILSNGTIRCLLSLCCTSIALIPFVYCLLIIWSIAPISFLMKSWSHTETSAK